MTKSSKQQKQPKPNTQNPLGKFSLTEELSPEDRYMHHVHAATNHLGFSLGHLRNLSLRSAPGFKGTFARKIINKGIISHEQAIPPVHAGSLVAAYHYLWLAHKHSKAANHLAQKHKLNLSAEAATHYKGRRRTDIQNIKSMWPLLKRRLKAGGTPHGS